MNEPRRWTLYGGWDSSGPDCRWVETLVRGGPDLKMGEEVVVIPAEVTDEMVDRAWNACIDLGLDHLQPEGSVNFPHRDEIREVLEAAITAVVPGGDDRKG